MILQTEEDGMPFKIIEAGQEISAPDNAIFRKFQPTGASAIVKAAVIQQLKREGSDDYATSGIYTNAGKETFGAVRGMYQTINCQSGSVIAWYK